MYQVLFVLSSVAAALGAGPPATVLDHAVELSFSADRTAERTTTWRVRIDDPAALSAGLAAPPGLDGAEDQGARVVDGTLLLPEPTAPGATLSLSAREVLGRGPLSGVFQTTSKAPTERASFTVTAPITEPLSVWADPGGTPTFGSAGSTRRIRVEWGDLAPDRLGELVWSTFASWDEASADLARTVNRKLTDKEQLGRAVAQDIEGLGLAGIVDRVFARVGLERGPGSWDTARSAAEVAKIGRGNAAERGVVLIAALRVAGIDAEPAYFRSRDARGSVPITVPAPVMVPEPLVIVHPGDGAEPVYVDPASQHAAVPDRPASLVGGTIWTAARPGSLPRALTSAPIDGEVHVSARLVVGPDGGATWSAEVEVTGAAAEVVRQRLAPLDDAGRVGVFAALVGRSRPTLDPARVTVNARGVARTDRELTLTVAGAEVDVMTPTAYGLRGEVPPLLALAMAAWLPPRTRISETLAIATPAAMRLIGSSRPSMASHPGALVERIAVRSGPQVSLTTHALRLSQPTSLAQHESAAGFLGEQAPVGIELLLLGEGRGSIPTRLRRADSLRPEDRAVLEALVRSADPSVPDRRVRRVLARATGSAAGPAGLIDRLRPRWWSGTPEVGFQAFTAALVDLVEPADGRVWSILTDLAERDADRIAVALGLDAVGRSDEALAIGRALVGSEDPRARLEAHLLVDRLQGPPPVEDLEPARAELWTDPVLLALRGRDAAAATANGTTRPDPRPYVRAAELAVEDGRPADAVSVVTGLDPEQEPLVAVLLARAAALGDLPAPEARRRILAAVARVPRDGSVTSAAADALAALGASIPPGEALAHALAAARLTGNAHRWDRVVPVALAAGDLPSAADAARRSSDLDPESVVRARRWATLATMALDREGAAVARERGRLPLSDEADGGWPPSLDRRLAMDESALLALLVHADDEVSEDPRLLAIRAELRIAAGLMDDAARDGLILASRHAQPGGAALAFAATAGRQFSTPVVAALDTAAATDATAMMTRMEYRLVAGTGDPLVDARRLGDDPRARALIKATNQPLLAAAAVEGWPRDVPPPEGGVPEGYRANRALSSIAGVVGFSNPDAGTAVLRVGAATGVVPPPIALLYTGRPRPVDSVDGGDVLRLDGGMMPLYAARAVVASSHEVWGLGFTPEGAKGALAAGMVR